MIIYDYHFYSSLKIDLEFYRIDKLHASGGQIHESLPPPQNIPPVW